MEYMEVRKVYGIGETICDIIFDGGQPKAAKPGGSTFNALVSLGRMGMPSSFISKLGDDKIGQMIVSFMHDNNIATENVSIWQGHKTDISLAFLDEQGDAHYSFYKEYDKQFVEAKIPNFKADDILLFGSYFALNPLLRPLMKQVLDAAQQAGCIIYYDPNFRSSHLHELDELRPILRDNMIQASIVRGSDEDFMNIFGTDDTWGELKQLVAQLVVTRNQHGVDVYSHAETMHFDAKPLQPLSTIGAGDSFNAGFIYALLEHDIRLADLENLTQEMWTLLVRRAIDFSSVVCMSYDNYIPLEDVSLLKKTV